MSEKTAKKFRKSIRKTSNKISSKIVQSDAWKIARQRDIIFLIALTEFIIIVFLGLVVLL